MKLNRKFIFLSAAFGGTFLFFFWRVYKSSDRKGLRRFVISVKIAGVLTFASFGSTATAKDTEFLPGSDAFTSQSSIGRPTTRTRSFGTETATGAAGSPKPGSGSGSSSSGSNSAGHSPAVPNGRTAPKPIDRPDVVKNKKLKNEEQCPVESISEPSKGPTSELIVKSDHQDQKVIITDRDVKKCMTQRDRNRSDDQKFNERLFKKETAINIKYPDEVYTKKYRGRLSTIYVKKFSDMEQTITIVDNTSGRFQIKSPITPEEYRNLTNKEKVELELTDLRRDPQIGIMNPKSLKEANTMKRAKEQGLVDDYRRPKLHLGESDVDFVGSNISYELKAVTQTKHKSYQDSANDIVNNIRDSAENMKVRQTLPYYLIDLGDLPDSLKCNMAQTLQEQLESINHLEHFQFVY